jgi:conjugal transfer mating pair stabilization protein TraN
MCVLPAPPNMPQGAFARVKGCLSTTRHFICLDSDAVITPPAPTGCEMTSTVDGLDWSSKSESASSDFIAVATSAEIARQLAAYGDKEGSEINNLFKGVALGCRNKGFGLKDCCTEKSAGVRSNAVMAAGMGAAGSAFQYGAGYAMQFGSSYMYDTIGPQVVGTFLEDGAYAMISGIESSGVSLTTMASNFGFMGFGLTQAGAGGIGATSGLFSAASSTQIGSVLGNPIFFNPYAFALAVGFQLVMATLECNELERELASARAEQLCQYVGNYCSSPIRVLGTYIGCTETTSNFCCFNGQLGKAIATGAREQLGMSWGSGETPSCGGFTMAQLSSVDFTKPAMQTALKPFQDQIMRNYQTKVAPGMASGQTELETRKAGDAAAKRLCQQRKALDPTTVCPG